MLRLMFDSAFDYVDVWALKGSNIDWIKLYLQKISSFFRSKSLKQRKSIWFFKKKNENFLKQKNWVLCAASGREDGGRKMATENV